MLLIIINNNYPCQGGTLENPKYPLPQTWSEQIIITLPDQERIMETIKDDNNFLVWVKLRIRNSSWVSGVGRQFQKLDEN